MAVRAVRGATQLEEDTREHMLDRVAELVTDVMEANDLAVDDFISIIFTATSDLTSEFPAYAARQLGFSDVPLVCARELEIEGSMPRVVRVLERADVAGRVDQDGGDLRVADAAGPRRGPEDGHRGGPPLSGKAAPKTHPVKAGDHLYLIDGSGYIFRAFHALPPLTRKSDGLPVGAVAGFCNMLFRLLLASMMVRRSNMPALYAPTPMPALLNRCAALTCAGPGPASRVSTGRARTTPRRRCEVPSRASSSRLVLLMSRRAQRRSGQVMAEAAQASTSAG